MARDADLDSTASSQQTPRVRGLPPGAAGADAEPSSEHVKIFGQDGVVPSPPTSQQPGDGSSGGEKPKQAPAVRPTLKDGIQSIKPDDFFSVHKIPCARQGLLTGIGTGAVVGAGRYIFGARIPKAANWAFGTFILGSVIQFEVCQAARYQEKAAMARVVEVMDRKKAEQAAAEEAARLRRKAAQEKAAAEKKKSWYIFW